MSDGTPEPDCALRDSGPARPVTLADIARTAGVHVTTVSRALRGSDDIGRATAERIRSVAKQLGYLPNPAAASLRTGRSRLLGVVVPRLTDVVLATIYEGIEQGSAEGGYQTLVANSWDEPDTQKLRADTLLAARVDGLILGDARTDSGLVGDLISRGTKVVLTSRSLPGAVSVTGDDRLGGRLAGEHLISLGHTDMAVIAGERYASTGIERTGGFLDACAHAGIEIPESRIVPSRFDVEGGKEGARRLLDVGPPPTAIFVVNDFAAIGAMGAVRDKGMLVGTDVAIVGYNDLPVAAALPVALSTVRSPMREMGRLAARTLVRMVEGAEGESVLLPPTFQARASSLGTT
ncbi:LacI family transcriptional regulator [Prauserella marina]|uniref:LacI family transcriptional regulator n=1 Tax=Prauserella marina TaxID=530584 RepID=A0A222VNP6_9PSEU|nr:LacI family DNA-binding transcriptional regulator [Prauserella marina]ASR35539.1 LacI family transcriptional regulator [Prauserella marina]PWV84621.1 LacI family transcriptional regulator [Prauserella marina]SDC17482.1 LacI family transcriptional regulator [Prauserella marina]